MGKSRGIQAERPRQIPKSGWKDILKRVKNQFQKDHIPIIAAGVAFYFFLAIFPALIAIVSIYGLVTDPAQLKDHMDQLATVMPGQAHDILSENLEKIVETADGTLGWSIVLSILFSLWSANKGTFSLFKGINITYDEGKNRGIVKQTAMTLAFTLGLMIVGIISISLVIAFPALIEYLGLPEIVQNILSWGRWLILALVIIGCLALIYQFAPQRKHPKLRWVSTGSIVATVLWIIGSLLFTLYVQNFDNFDEMYGTVAAVVILMLWLNLTAFLILVGAEINSELEHQTRKDTTRGEEKPLGERGGYHADHVASENSDQKYR